MSSSQGESVLAVIGKETNLYGNAGFDWQNYADARPKYPEELFDALFRYHRGHKGEFDLACDFGTGIGTILPSLLSKFKQVYASDSNPHQLGILRSAFSGDIADKRVVVLQTDAGQEMPLLQDDSADLFVAATAAHWFDRPAWFQQAVKKLKPGGTLCFFNYQTKPVLFTHPQAEDAFTKLHEYFFAPAYQAERNRDLFFAAALADSVSYKTLEGPPSTFFKDIQRHFWHFDPSICWTYPHKHWLERVMGVYPNDGTHNAIAPDTKIVDHPSTIEGAPTSIAYEDWTLDHLIAYLTSMGSAPSFDSDDVEFRSIRQELESALGGPGQTFGVSWQATMLLSTKK